MRKWQNGLAFSRLKSNQLLQLLQPNINSRRENNSETNEMKTSEESQNTTKQNEICQ